MRLLDTDGVDSAILDPDRRDSSGIIEGLQMTASTRVSSHTHLNRIDEARGNITVEGGHLSVNEKNADQPTTSHHTIELMYHNN